MKVADGVFISGLGPSNAEPLAPPAAPRDETLDSSTARVAVAAPLVLAILVVTGLGWSFLLTRDSVRALALSPAFGTAAIVLGGVVADRIGLRLDDARAGLLVLALVAAAGYLLLLVGERRRGPRPTP